MQHSLYLKNVMNKLEGELAIAKEKLKKEVVGVKARADKDKKRALAEQKIKRAL